MSRAKAAEALAQAVTDVLKALDRTPRWRWLKRRELERRLHIYQAIIVIVDAE